jgi:hypothetical protein
VPFILEQNDSFVINSAAIQTYSWAWVTGEEVP